MEKYYLANLTTFSSEKSPERSSSWRGKIKLVDIQYVRRGPSFGLVQFEEISAQQQISLSILELADNKTATIRPEKQVNLTGNYRKSKIVDFDIRETILMDAGNSLQANKLHPHCIVLAENGDLLAVNLTATTPVAGKQSVERLTSGCEQQSEQAHSFLQCKLQITANDDCYVHSLAIRYYRLHKLVSDIKSSMSAHKLELICEYSLPNDQFQSRLLEMYPMEFNPQLVVVKLTDSSVRVLHQSVCRASIGAADFWNPSSQSTPESRHLVLSTNQSQNECLLVSLSQTSVVARRLRVSGEPQSDPDELLMKEPSFELEECWRIELNDIESVRALDQDPAFVPGLAIRSCPMWSSNQLNREACWPKFLLIIYEYHLLVYSFEQPLTNPFSLLYDSSFLSFASPEANSAQFVDADSSIKLLRTVKADQELQENIDVKQRPKLVHNFKLIGAQPTDSLFNTLFLVLRARLQVIKQFDQLGILVAVSQLGHLLAFKFTSFKLNPNKEAVYQQLVAQSLAEGSLLRHEASRLEAANKSFRENLSLLERRNQFGQDELAGGNALNALLHCHLEVCEDDQTGSLYELSISLPNLLQVSRIVIISTVTSYFLEPNSSAIDSYHIENSASVPLKQVLIDEINFLTSIKRSGDEHIWAQIEQMLDRQHLEGVQSYALLNLVENCQDDLRLRLAVLNLGQAGFIKVFYLFNIQPSEEQYFKSSLIGSLAFQEELDFDSDQSVFQVKSIKIKPLMSYKLQPDGVKEIKGGSATCCLRIAGQFEPATIANWLDECLHLRRSDGSTPIGKGSFYCLSTRCHINFDIHEGGNQLELLSDDLIALELIKKRLLKRATEAQVTLNINETVPNTKQLLLMIDLQLENLSIIERRLSSWSEVVQSKPNMDDQAGLLMDTLASEVVTLPGEDSPDWLLESLREDVKMLMLKQERINSSQTE